MSMTKRRVAITGLGALTPVGIGVKASWEAILTGRCGTSEITLFDASNYEIKIAAEVKNFNPGDFMLPEVYRKTDRFAQFGVAAAKMAIEDSGVEIDRENNRIPVVIGSGLGGSLFHEEQIFRLIEGKDPRRVLSSSVPRIAPNAVSAYIAMQFKLRGPNLTISTACSSGGNAISLAAQQIENGNADLAITGGVECPITPFTFAAYQSLRVLSKGKSGYRTPRPFDRLRDGFVLGEGAGILVLEDLEHARTRGAKIYAELAGYSSNCGAYHMATPEPSGLDAVLAIEEALQRADIHQENISYINAHGTATEMNDICEAKAIGKVFGFGKKGPLVSSTKSATGHTIGAAGAIEAIFTVLAIKDNTIPSNLNCDDPDENCDIRISLGEPVKTNVRYAMSNSFGFGSNNSVLIFSKSDGN